MQNGRVHLTGNLSGPEHLVDHETISLAPDPQHDRDRVKMPPI